MIKPLSYYSDILNKPLLALVCHFNQLSDQQMNQLLYPEEYIRSNHPSFLDAYKMINQAITNHEKIIVCGDFDADGICATSILVRTLRRYTNNVGYYIPHRSEEGYGLNMNTVELALKKNYTLFITVDNGVSANESLDMIKSANAKSIVIDHHTISETVHCDVLIHTDLLDETYGTACASGLVYQLSTLFFEDPYHAALAAVATIADMVDLWGFNRSLVIRGLDAINTHHYETIWALCDKINVLDEQGLSFQIIPKINAIGRLNEDINVNQMVEYFISTSSESILAMAKRIFDLNNKRKLINETMYLSSLTQINDDHTINIVSDPAFHEGVVGITAGKLVELTHKPSIVLAFRNGMYKGSARSIEGYDLRVILKESLQYANRFGGHAMAYGLSIKEENFADFIQSVYSHTDTLTLDLFKPKESLVFDGDLFNLNSYRELLDYGPFGQGFKLPMVLVGPLQLEAYRSIKGGFKAGISYQGQYLDIVSFKYAVEECIGQLRSYIGVLQINTFRETSKLSLLVQSVI